MQVHGTWCSTSTSFGGLGSCHCEATLDYLWQVIVIREGSWGLKESRCYSCLQERQENKFGELQVLPVTYQRNYQIPWERDEANLLRNHFQAHKEQAAKLTSWKAVLQKSPWESQWRTRWTRDSKCSTVARRADSIVGCRRKAITRRSSGAIFPFYSALVRPYLECCPLFWACEHEVELSIMLGRVYWKATNTVGGYSTWLTGTSFPTSAALCFYETGVCPPRQRWSMWHRRRDWENWLCPDLEKRRQRGDTLLLSYK